MSTVDKLQHLIRTKTAIKDAIVEKGISVADTDTFASYPDKIKAIQTGGGEGGDKLFIENRTGTEFVEGDKVLVNFTSNDDVDYHDAWSMGAYYTLPIVLEDGTIKVTDQYTRKGYEIKHTVNGFVETVYSQTVFIDSRYPYIIDGDYAYFSPVNSYKMAKQNIRTSEATQYEDFPLTDEILLDFDKGILYNNDKSLSYDTGVGSSANSQNMFQIFGNTLVLSQTNAVHFIDITDFPNCTKITYTLPMTFDINYGVSGISEGDYLISYKSGTFHFLKFDGAKYNYNATVVCKSNSCSFINHGSKLYSFINTSNTPIVYVIEEGVLKRLEVPVEVLNVIKNDVVADTEKTQCFATNKTFTDMVWTYNKIARWCHLNEACAVYATESIPDNFSPAYSFTGIATGEKDALGREEVSLTLPEKIGLNITTSVDVKDDEIVFEGVL